MSWLKDSKTSRLRQDTVNVRVCLKIAASSLSGSVPRYENTRLLADALTTWRGHIVRCTVRPSKLIADWEKALGGGEDADER